MIHSFKGHNLYFHFLAITLTVVILKSGLDWYYFLAVRDPLLNSIFLPALAIGFVLPIIIPFVFIIKGYLKKDNKASVLGWCLGQAALAGWIISSTYKAFTGRVQPNLLDLVNDSSNSFQFGFWEHGIFWGWPSSHTTVAFAMVFALISMYPKHKMLTTLSIIYALYIGIGVSFSVHWFSEFVSGLIIGTVIGLTIGDKYSENFKK